MALIQTVHLSMANFKSAPVVPAVQNDTDRQIKMVIDDFDLTAGLTGKITFVRSDGTHYEASATLDTATNSFTADIDQALTQPGRTMVQLKVTDTLTVSTFSFVIFVEEDTSGTVTPQEGIDLVTAVEAAEDAADRAESAASTFETDTTLSVSGMAADAKTVGDEIGDLKITFEDASGLEEISFTENGYINLTGSTTNLTPVPSNSYRYAIVDCEAGDNFTISCTGTASERPYGFVDTSGNILFARAAGTMVNYNAIAPEGTVKLVINDQKTGTKCYKGSFPAHRLDQLEYASTNLLDYAENNESEYQHRVNGRTVANPTLTYGVFESSGYASPATVNYVKTQKFEAGLWSISVPVGYQYEIYTYNSDSSGTSLISWRNTALLNRQFISPFVITICKSPISTISRNDIDYLELFTDITKFDPNDVVFAGKKSDKSFYNRKFADYIFDSLFSYDHGYDTRTGTVLKSPDVVFHNNPLSYVFSKNTTVQNNNEFRIYPRTTYNLVGISAFVLPIYTEESNKITGITLTIEKPSGTAWTRTISGSTLHNGWNYCKLYTRESNIVVWDSASMFRVLCSYNSSSKCDVYIGDIIAVKPAKAKLIFVDDHGYSNFYTVAYPQLRALGVPVTWAIQPGALGESGGVSGKLTQTEIDTMASDPMCEFSFHSWQSDATASMTDVQIMEDVQKCITYLKQHGILPTYFWRAAWVQNKATNAAAAKYILKAYASPSENYGTTDFPFPNRYNITRVQLHGTSDFTSLFETLRKTHCTAVVYTHDIDDGGGIHMTTAEFTAFVTALTNAISNGYVEPTTFSRLITKYGDEDIIIA